MEPRLTPTNNGVKRSVSRRATKGSSVMSARIIDLAAYRALRVQECEAPQQPGRPEKPAKRINEANRFHFWTGASGKRYVHTVYELFECPPLPPANYVLVQREPGARRKVLSIGRVGNSAASLNLAEIRQRGAELGADEVHVHLLAESAKLAKLVEFDLRTGQMEADVARLTGEALP